MRCETGGIAPVGSGEYALTEKGRTAMHETEHPFYLRLGEIAALPPEELAQLETLLDKVVAACLEAPEAASKWCIGTTHRGHPKEEYGPLARIDQHLDDLSAFRDDAHLSAWQPYGVRGQVWEALTFVWRGNARTAEELAEKLSIRGYAAEAYGEALAELARRGWVETAPEGYRATEKGRALRQEAEEATDRTFFAPWACLSGTERIQLHDLLTRARNNLQGMAGSA